MIYRFIVVICGIFQFRRIVPNQLWKEAQGCPAPTSRKLAGRKQEAISIEIDPEVVDADDIDTLQDLILSAVNEGLRQSQQNMQNSLGQQIGKMTGGLDLSSILNPKS